MAKEKKSGVGIKYDTNVYLHLGKDKNDFTFIYAKSGWGKTLLIESLMEEYKRRGYTIIVLSDVKDSFEFMFAMFEPRDPIHLEHLRIIGKPKRKYDCKIYHPFTFNVKKDKQLPEINFYGFSLKNLRRSEWSLLSESASESETIRLLLNATFMISKSEGLYSFLHKIQESVVGKKDKKQVKADPKTFYLNTSIATGTGLREVASYLLPYKRDYFLVPDNSPIKINFKELINDNKHYHLFTTKWIIDEKAKEFCILTLLNGIVKDAKDNAKKPILIVLPEIRFLVPNKIEGYKKFLSEGIRKNLSVMRNIGKGMSGIFDSQVWVDVSDEVKNSATVSFYGELGGEQDIDRVVKANRFDKEVSEKLRKMVQEPDDPFHCYIKKGNEKDPGTFRGFFPAHCHNEEKYNFFEMYKEEYPKKMKNYNKLIDSMKTQLKEEENKFKEKIKQRERKEKEDKRLRELKKQESKIEKQTVDEKIEKAKEIESRSKEQIMKLCYEMRNDETLDKRDKSFRKIGDKFGKNKLTAKRYIEQYQKILEKQKQEEDSKDFEEKVVEELEVEEE